MVNLPHILKCALAAVLCCVATFVAAEHGFHLPWQVLAAVVFAAVVSAGYRILKSALVEIVIDGERLTVRTGVLTRRAASVELYRIQNVESTSAWWQRLLGFGTLIIYSSDMNHPRWCIPGMVELEHRRQTLNRAAIALREAKGIREVNMGRA
ncbi:hypothetical protein R70006_06302 [Paraburkholderia domus]|uniref:PH domain-containing protein n=1 Tax=Paraburkholderia domus TaxID=2793075 RepID=UPI001B1F5D13|nr:PH domain-containing protein [Paraburkholderia domus]CAE6823132.1 hypothetical protein R70006_06302 [Paraburkholderia domus]